MGAKTDAGEPECARWPRLAAAPRQQLRPLVPRGYAGFTEATAPSHLVLPATTSVPLVVKIIDSPHRPPPAFVMGAHGSYSVLEGDCAPSYLEASLHDTDQAVIAVATAIARVIPLDRARAAV
jgi:hypothetical protein